MFFLVQTSCYGVPLLSFINETYQLLLSTQIKEKKCEFRKACSKEKKDMCIVIGLDG